jgi:hypothetical protein
VDVIIGWEGAEWTGLVQDVDRWWAFINLEMSTWFYKRREFLDRL